MTLTIEITPEEEVRLAEESQSRGQSLAELVRTALSTLLDKDMGDRPSWSEAAGMFSYPMVGEDAQAWVSRNRHEGDEHREPLLRRGNPQTTLPDAL